jgi:hypothetical protein
MTVKGGELTTDPRKQGPVETFLQVEDRLSLFYPPSSSCIFSISLCFLYSPVSFVLNHSLKFECYCCRLPNFVKKI